MTDWIQEHQALLWTLGGLSILTFLGTLLAIPFLVVWIPADYFLPGRGREDSWAGGHPLIRFSLLALKNLLGGLFVIAGVAMLFLPGQGALTILIGLSLLNFPGKRELELRIVRVPAVLRSINWMRARRGRRPLDLPARKERPGRGPRDRPERDSRV